MIARIAKQFTFDAAHFLPGLPEDHPCSRMHGHTYGVELQLVGPVDDKGFVLDYADIARAWKHVRELVDHRVLNEVSGLERPTTENVAAWIIIQLSGCSMFRTNFKHRVLAGEFGQGEPRIDNEACTLLERVIVRESSTTWCEMTVVDVRRFLLDSTTAKAVLLPYAEIR